MKELFLSYATSLIGLLCMDGVWLTLAADRLYKPALKAWFNSSFRYEPAAVFYVIYAAALVALVIHPALTNHDSYGKTFLMGATLGLAAYAAYDLTNMATLKGWPLPISLIDMAWGAILTGTVASLVLLVMQKIK